MYRIMSFITFVRFLSLSKLEAIAFNWDLERGFILNVIRTNSGIALMMLSIIVTFAAREVRDMGLRSIAITTLPGFLAFNRSATAALVAARDDSGVISPNR